MSTETQGKTQTTISLVIAILGLIGTLGTSLFNNWDKVFPEPKAFEATAEISPVIEDRNDFSIDESSNPWTPGQEHPNSPNVIAAEATGEWSPAIGYTWMYPDDPNNLEVVWNPGETDPNHPNIVASDTEGNWTPAPGYDWLYPDDVNSLEVTWSPGKEDPRHPNVVASDTEGTWSPAPGYDWAYPDDDSNFEVVSVNG